MPDQAYYDDATDSAVAPTETPPDSSPEDATEEEGATALLPKSFFPEEPQPGGSYSVKVVRVHDDQVECTLEPEAKEEQAEAAPAPTAAPDSMME